MPGAFLFPPLFWLWTAGWGLLTLPVLALPAGVPAQRCATIWVQGALLLLRLCCGVDHRVVGREHLPAGPVVVAAKHQSAWETLAMWLVFDRPVFILKRELLRIPIVGWYLARTGAVPIDRASGARALRQMVQGARRALAGGRCVVVFPEGTRTPPGTSRPYRPGIAALYAGCDAPVIPVALNSGHFWPRRGLVRRRGTITVSILPPLPADLDRRAFVAALHERIETETARIAPTY